jgi:hypothetical protein
MGTNYNGATNMDYSTESPFSVVEGNWMKSLPDINAITAGQETMPLLNAASTSVVISTGNLRLTYFTATRAEAVTKCSVYTGGVAAGATPTVCRMALYKVEANGDLTEVATTPNDTTLFAATFTAYTKSFSAPYTLVKGQRYAIGICVVTAAATPTFVGFAYPSVANLAFTNTPRLAALVGSLTNLPASPILNAGLSASSMAFYVQVLP